VNQYISAPPAIRPRRNGAYNTERCAIPTGSVSLFVSIMMIEKISVVAPTTAVPMRTGFAVALNVLPAPSFCSSLCLAPKSSGDKIDKSDI
jgi:hypothetical protein